MIRYIKTFFLLIAAGTLTVSCSDEPSSTGSIELSSAEISVPRAGHMSDGTSVTVIVKSDTYWRAFIPEDTGWLDVTPKGAPAGETEVTLSVESNIDGPLRKGRISFEGLGDVATVLSVTQKGNEDAPRMNAAIEGYVWKEGDRIDIIVDKESVPFYWSGSFFTSDFDLEESGAKAAVFPSGTSVSFDGTNVTAPLPQKQSHDISAELNPNMIYAGVSSSDNFTLEPLFSTLRVDIKGKGTPLALSLSAGEAATVLDLGNGIALSATPAIADIVAPEYSGHITVGVTDASGEEQLFEFDEVSLKKGETSEISLEYESSSAYRDLNMPSFYGESGTEKVFSNCYMISTKGDYKFAAADIDGTKVECADVKWVWATSGVWNSSASCVLETMIKDLVYDKGTVKFSVPEDFTPGNVILGAVDDKGVAKYLWHIWITVNPADVNVNGTLWMDRNIGASYVFDPEDPGKCNAARGFYYNWGCKNPIVGLYEGTKSGAAGDTFTQGKGATYYIYNSEVANTGEWAPLQSYPEGWTGSMTDCAAYPMSLFDNATYAPTSNQKIDWPEEANPCPYGYSVMSIEQAKALGTLETMTTVCDADDNMMNVASVNSGVVFPSCGYRANSTAKITLASNPDGRYWANSSNTATKRDYWLMNRSNCKAATAGIGPGMSVRCVKNNNN